MDRNAEQQFAKQGRLVALVIAGSMLLWLAAQIVGPQIGLAGRFAVLFDLMALAALFWALIVAIKMWRIRHENKG